VEARIEDMTITCNDDEFVNDCKELDGLQGDGVCCFYRKDSLLGFSVPLLTTLYNSTSNLKSSKNDTTIHMIARS